MINQSLAHRVFLQSDLEAVVVTCECGHRSMSRPCYENNSEYQRIATSLLASKMADVQLGRSVNLDDMQGPRKFTIKSLECSEECRVVERNRRLAIGLQIRNPDLSAKLTPRYSDLMRGWAKKDQRFCQYVHEKLTELVKLAKEFVSSLDRFNNIYVCWILDHEGIVENEKTDTLLTFGSALNKTVL
ncbi:Transcriptional repressor NF-X1 [Homalodisca vitripennis]|nr:Transcriptional repressor NF-X1 [Homalodisca vitripennis]